MGEEYPEAKRLLQIIIPLATFIGGMATQHVIATRTLAHQDFEMAAKIATSDSAEKMLR